METYENDFIRLVPNDLNITQGRFSSEASLISDRIRDFYLGSRPISEDVSLFLNVNYYNILLISLFYIHFHSDNRGDDKCRLFNLHNYIKLQKYTFPFSYCLMKCLYMEL